MSQRQFFSPMQRMGGGAPASAQPKPTPTSGSSDAPAAPKAPLRGPATVAPKVVVETAREIAIPPTVMLVEALGVAEEGAGPADNPEAVDAFFRDSPGLARQIVDLIQGLARGSVPWFEALSLSDRDVVEMAQLVVTTVMQGRFPAAEDGFAVLCDLSPGVPLLWLGLGDVLEEQNKPEAALEAYARCIETAESIDPSLPEAMVARYHRGGILSRAEAHEEAARELIGVVRNDPEPAGDRAASAAGAVQALLNEGKISPGLLQAGPDGAIGSGWRLEGSALAYSGPVAQPTSVPPPTAGSRLFASAKLSQGVTYNQAHFRGEPNSFRTDAKFVNLARPLCKRSIARAGSTGSLVAVERPAPGKARQRLLGVLAKRQPEELRGIYQRVWEDLKREGKVSADEAESLTLRASRLQIELRQFFKQRATAMQLDRNYRNARTVEFRASRFRAGTQNPPGAQGAAGSQSMPVNTNPAK
jgi:hypothetical protein